MKNLARSVVQFAMAASMFLCAGLAHVAETAPPVDKGLEQVKTSSIDQVYKRPDASLAGYTRILLRPVDVSFARHWNPRDFGTFGLSPDDVAKIRSDLAALAQETFAKTLTDGGYPVVTAPGEGVLEVKARLVDLYVNAPDTLSSGRNTTYVMNAGEMRLLAELNDSVTGSTLYWIQDKKQGTDLGHLQWANKVFNRAEAERALRGWANQLKNALDAAKAN